MAISINTTIGQATILLSQKSPKRFREEVAASINETIDYGKKQVMKLLVEKYAISAARLRSSSGFNLTEKRPTAERMRMPEAWGGTGGKAVGEINLSSRRLPVIYFKVTPTYVPVQKGLNPPYAPPREIVTVETIRGSPMINLPNRFMAQTKTGHLGVFLRKKNATPRWRSDIGQKTWLPIQQMMMISPSEMIGGKRIRPVIERRMEKFLDQALTKNLKKMPGAK